ncbi:hypothetical protein B0H14DRAFT_3158075 [Mycena olivaceomarginata]|nr:hypothetical protein B0H14DRAFT_3158075 [Mycena olivaceomarginata]
MGHSTSCSENPGCTACALHNYETDEIRIRSSGRHKAPELAATEFADTGGQRAREVAPAQAEHVADTARADDTEGAAKAAHGEAAYTADTAHAGGTESTVKAVHGGAERVAEPAHADDAEQAVEVVHDEAAHGEAAHAADTAHAEDAEGAAKAVRVEAEGVADTAHVGDAERAVEVVHGEEAHGGAEHTTDTAHAGNAEGGRQNDSGARRAGTRGSRLGTRGAVARGGDREDRSEEDKGEGAEEQSPPTAATPVPHPKATTPTALTTRTAASAHAATDAGLRSVMTAEDELLEDEYERICIVQAHAPVRGVAVIQDVRVHQLQEAQQAKIQRRAAEALGQYLEGGKSANARVKARVSAAQAQHRQDSAAAAKWARHRQAEAVWRVLQLEASDQGCETEGQARVFVESECGSGD